MWRSLGDKSTEQETSILKVETETSAKNMNERMVIKMIILFIVKMTMKGIKMIRTLHHKEKERYIKKETTTMII